MRARSVASVRWRLLRPTVCFAEGTLVVTGVNEDGSYQLTKIEDLEEGDLVYSRDQYNEDDDAGLHTIVEVFRNVSDHLRIIEVRDANGNVETIRTTDEHPFYLSGLGWVSAKDLQPGDRLSEADGTNDAVVLTSTREEHPNGVAVYNFEVAGDHTYYVADGQGLATAVWVHNKCSEVATDLQTGVTTFRLVNKFAAGSAESRQLQRFITAWNGKIVSAGGTMVRRSLTSSEEKLSAAWKRLMRRIQPKRFANRVVGHLPDAAAGGKVAGGKTMALYPTVNAYLGGALQNIPIGTKYHHVKLVRTL